MELTGEQLKIAENQLKESLLPQAQQVYGYLVLRNRLEADPLTVLVDEWPDFNVLICKPVYKTEGDLFKDTCVFAKNSSALRETLKKAGVDWTKYLCFGINICDVETVKAVASERNVCGSIVAVCHMMLLQDLSSLPPVDCSDMTLSVLNESHIGLVNQAWKFGQEEHSISMIRNMITNFPSSCLLDAENQPVAWMLSYASCALGVLYVKPEHRGKGYAKVLISTMAKRLHALGYPVYCFIEEENTVSYKLFKNMGFTEDPSHRTVWLIFNNF